MTKMLSIVALLWVAGCSNEERPFCEAIVKSFEDCRQYVDCNIQPEHVRQYHRCLTFLARNP